MKAGVASSFRVDIVGVPVNSNDSLRGAMRIGDKLSQRVHDATVKSYLRCALSAENIDALESAIERAIVAVCVLDDVPIGKARGAAREAILGLHWHADEDASYWLTNIRQVLRYGSRWRSRIRLVTTFNREGAR